MALFTVWYKRFDSREDLGHAADSQSGRRSALRQQRYSQLARGP